MTISVETSIQSQCDEIGAVRYGFASVVATRGNGLTGNAPLWNFVWLTDNQPYINAVIGSTLLGVDTGVNAAQVGSGLFNQWFQLQNTYFSQNNASYPDPVTPTNRVSTLANAVANYFRWRIGYYFNQTMGESVGTANDVAFQNVFPAHGTAIAGATMGSSTLTFAPNPNIPNPSLTTQPFSTLTIGGTAYPISNPAFAGPGVLGVYPTTTQGATYSVTCIYEQSPHSTNTGTPTTSAGFTVVIPAVTAPLSTTARPTAIVGEPGGAFAAGSTSYNPAYNSAAGAISVLNGNQYIVGQKVLIAAGSLTGATAVYTEVAEVTAVGASSVTVAKAMAGATATGNALGVRNNGLAFSTTGPGGTGAFYNGGYVYPLFSGVSAASRTAGGASGDHFDFAFVPDRPQII